MFRVSQWRMRLSSGIAHGGSSPKFQDFGVGKTIVPKDEIVRLSSALRKDTLLSDKLTL